VTCSLWAFVKTVGEAPSAFVIFDQAGQTEMYVRTLSHLLQPISIASCRTRAGRQSDLAINLGRQFSRFLQVPYNVRILEELFPETYSRDILEFGLVCLAH
jgi:hypothetical protein